MGGGMFRHLVLVECLTIEMSRCLLYQRTDKMLCICHDYKAKQFQFTLCIYRVCSGTARTGFGTLKREEPELWCRVIWNRLCIYIVPPKTQ